MTVLSDSERRILDRRASRYGDEPLYDALPPKAPVEVVSRGLWQDDWDRSPGYDRGSWDLDGCRDEERDIALGLREAGL